MNKISVNQEKSKRTGVKFSFKSMLMLMAAIMMALVTLTACPVDDENEDDPDEIENGENGNNGGVAGKRIKTELQTTGTKDDFYRTEWSYNSDGTVKQSDSYNESSKRVEYTTYTNNTDGTIAKEESYELDNSSNFKLFYVYNYSYDDNKKPLQMLGSYYDDKGEVFLNMTFDFTYQNGRKTRQVVMGGDSMINEYEYSYDSQGRRTKTIETTTYSGQLISTRQIDYTYNTDGTLQKKTYPSNADNSTVTKTYTWEDGKTTVNIIDDYFPF